MKIFLKYVVVAASGLMILASCAKDNLVSKEPVTQSMELSFSGAKPALGGDTRTEISGNSVIWSQTGERIRMTYSYNGDFTTDPAASYTTSEPKFYASTGNANVDEHGSTATFTISTDFKETRTGGIFQFYALYPSAAGDSKFTDATDISMSVESKQAPTTTSFDASADVMIAKASQTYTSLDEAKAQAIPLVYKRVVTHGHITLKSLAFQEGETVKSVTITAPEGTLITGQSRMDIVAQTLTAKTSAVNSVTLDYGAAGASLSGGNFEVWFCSLPFTVAGGEQLTVVVTSSRGTYTRTITAREKGIQFPVNRHSTLGINMEGVECVETVVVDPGIENGDYMVIARLNSTGKYFAMSCLNTISTERLNRVEMVGLTEITEDLTLTTKDPTLVWTIAKDGDNYTMINGVNYLGWQDGSTNGARVQETEYFLSIVDSEIKGCYYIRPASNNTRYLSLNSTNTNEYFAFYGINPAGKPSQTADLYLVPVTVVPVPKIDVEENLQLDYDQESAEIAVTLTNDYGVVPSVAYYDGDEGETIPEWFMADYNTETGKIDVIAEVNESAERSGRIVITLANDLGTATATVTVTQAATGVQITLFRKVTSTPAEGLAGQYLIVCETAKKAIGTTVSANWVDGDNVPISDGIIEFNPTTKSYICTIAPSGKYYSILAPTGKYLGLTSNNSYLKSNGSSGDTTNYQWGISIDSNGNAQIQSRAFTSRYIRYSNSSSRFACYTIQQADIQLYKLVTE